MHRLNLGLRTFEPMTFEPSPWNKIDFPTYTARDISRLDRRIGALMPQLSSRVGAGAFIAPEQDDFDAFDCILSQRFVRRDQQREEKRKREKEEKDREAKGKRRKVVLGLGAGEAAGVQAQTT